MLQTQYHRSPTASVQEPGVNVHSSYLHWDFDWRQLFRHVRLIALCVAICFALGLAYVKWRTPAYTASADLLIEHRVVQFPRADTIYAASGTDDTLVGNQLAILRSEAIAMMVIESLGLEDQERFPLHVTTEREMLAGLFHSLHAPFLWLIERAEDSFPTSLEMWPQLHSISQSRPSVDGADAALIAFNANLVVEASGGDHTITIRYTAPDPELAATITNEIVRIYLDEQVAMNKRAARAASGWLRETVAALGTSARVLKSARPPDMPTGLGTSIVIAGALVGGLIFGFAGAYMREITGRRIFTPKEVTAATGAPCLAALPLMRRRWGHVAKDGSQRTAAHENVIQRQAPAFSWVLDYPLSRFAHGINRLAIAVTDDAGAGGFHRVIGTTSLCPNEGSTVVAANLGQLLAKRGHRVLLIDAVPHDGALSRGFSIQKGAGLAEVMGNDADFLRTVWTDPQTGLDILPLATFSEVRASSWPIWIQAMERVVKHQQYEYTIVDLPPIGLVPDAIAAARFVDGLVLVMERGVVRADILGKTLAAAGLVQDRLIGVVMNKIRSSRWQAFVDGDPRPRRAYRRYVNSAKRGGWR